MQLDNFVALQSSQFPGSHIGALPSGQVTSPTMTPATSDAAFFKVVFLVSVQSFLMKFPVIVLFLYCFVLLHVEKTILNCKKMLISACSDHSGEIL